MQASCRIRPQLPPLRRRGVQGRLDGEARQAQPCARLGQRHLRLLQRAHQPVYAAHLPREPLHAGHQLGRVERVLHAPVPGEVGTHVGRHAFQRFLRRAAA